MTASSPSESVGVRLLTRRVGKPVNSMPMRLPAKPPVHHQKQRDYHNYQQHTGDQDEYQVRDLVGKDA